MNWRYYVGTAHDWSWYFDLPTGWTAAVHDYSQMTTPQQPTKYIVSAICAHFIRQGKDSYTTLEDAKKAALDLAMLQHDVCNGVNTEHQQLQLTSSVTGSA